MILVTHSQQCGAGKVIIPTKRGTPSLVLQAFMNSCQLDARGWEFHHHIRILVSNYFTGLNLFVIRSKVERTIRFICFISE